MATSRGPMGSFLGTQFNAIRNLQPEFISRKYLYFFGFLFAQPPP